MPDEDLEFPRQPYDDFNQRLADWLIGQNLQPREWFGKVIYHRRGKSPDDGYSELIPLTRLQALVKENAALENIDAKTASSFRKVHQGPIINVQKFEEDLARLGAENTPPEDKKHLLFSMLSPESIMIMKRLNDYARQKEIDVSDFIKNYSYEQVVQTKTKKSEVAIVKADVFFSVLKSLRIYEGTHRQNLMEFLCLDKHYRESLMVKKLLKACQYVERYQYFRGHRTKFLEYRKEK